MSMINYSELDLKEESVIRINRVAKVNSRGKRFSFSTLVVIGDGKAHVGIGAGKANEVIVSITKAKDDAKQNLVKVPVYNYTIPHEIIGKHGASRVLLKPAPKFLQYQLQGKRFRSFSLFYADLLLSYKINRKIFRRFFLQKF